MQIHAYRRKEAFEAECYGITTKFAPNDKKHVVGEATDERVVARLLSISEAYIKYADGAVVLPGAPKPGQVSGWTAAPAVVLPVLGGKYPDAEIELAEDRFVNTVDAIQQILDAAGKTVADWNALAQADRDALLDAKVADMRRVLGGPDPEDEPDEGDDARASAPAPAPASVPAPSPAPAPAADGDDEDQNAPETEGLVLKNDATGETLDIGGMTAKQVRAFADANEVVLPKGNSTPVAELRRLLYVAMTTPKA